MRAIVLLSTLFVIPALADSIAGRVVGVSDGDTLTLLSGREQIKVRLTEIDAPEKAQPFGNRSKQSLSALCFNKSAKLDDQGKDRYGRTLARVHCDGIDANAEQVRRGMAWVYDRYVTDRSLYGLQDEARGARRGLWADPSPMPPWEWRKQAR
ncbi:MAG: thermonuclease family protein [Rhodocyclaceae bacterium]|nr:thermonuclease family protein [Rhodocyclaceae bacterium]